MRWVVFAIVLFVLLVIQTALTPLIAVQGVRPDLLALLAAHAALAAPPADALIAVWVIGFLFDLNGLAFPQHANVGAAALAYGLSGLAVVRMRRYTFRDHAAAYFTFSLLIALSVHALTGLHMLFVTGQLARWPQALAAAAGTALYTALISPYAHWLFRRQRSWFGFGPMQTLRVR